MGTQILPCKCEHKYQDEKYGKYMRVHNKGVSKTNREVWVCTVCKLRKEK